jgi:hypothetical protein
MSIFIRDETANATVLTIDNSGNMAFGDGTPITPVTIAGHGVIDSNGFIVHGLGSCSVNGVSGSVNVGLGETATIPTLAGRLPTAQLDTQYPALAYSTGEIGQLLTDRIYGTPVHIIFSTGVGQFAIKNQNQATEDAQINVNNDAILNNAPCGYRWL